MTTVLECIESGTKYLEKKGVEDARRNMQLMVAHVLGCTRTQLYMQFDRPLEEAQLLPLREMLKKRGERIPLQHLLEKIVFCGREFRTDARALIPRPETEELAEILCKEYAPQSILDMGCGSGVLGLSLAAHFPQAEVTLADVSTQALSLTKENAASLSLTNITLIESNLFSNISTSFDLIVANLPYVPERDRATLTREVMHDPALALFSGEDGLTLIRKFLPIAFSHLNPNGSIALEIGYDQAEEVEALMQQAGFSDVHTKTDLSGVKRFPFGRKL